MLSDVSDARVLDVYCGTGALAIEALSRGAAHATLVDSQPKMARRNVEELGLSERAEVIGRDALRFLRAEQGNYDLILCDPPYTLAARFGDALGPLLASRLAAGGRMIVETAIGRPLPVPLALARERRYGDTLVRLHTGEARP
jgi:16S rRNA (guanine966-N2)-methyltransferase